MYCTCIIIMIMNSLNTNTIRTFTFNTFKYYKKNLNVLSNLTKKYIENSFNFNSGRFRSLPNNKLFSTFHVYI